MPPFHEEDRQSSLREVSQLNFASDPLELTPGHGVNVPLQNKANWRRDEKIMIRCESFAVADRKANPIAHLETAEPILKKDFRRCGVEVSGRLHVD